MTAERGGRKPGRLRESVPTLPPGDLYREQSTAAVAALAALRLLVDPVAEMIAESVPDPRAP
jgi:hypothetical protein